MISKGTFILSITLLLLLISGCTTRDGVVKSAEPGSLVVNEKANLSARVFLDGKEMGTMTAGLYTIDPVSPGEHEIALFSEGFSIIRQSIDISEGEQKNITFQLVNAESGTITVEAIPGSSIELTGLTIGTTDSSGIFTQKGFPTGVYPLLVNSGGSILDTIATIKAGMVSTISATIEVQQKVLVEYISNTDCNYCPSYGKIMHQILDSINNRRILKVASHANWPGKGDPFFAFNSKPQEDLAKSYGAKLKYALPMFAVNGEPITHQGDTALFRTLFLDAIKRNLAEPVQLAISLTHEYITVTNRTDITFTGTLFVNLTENKVVYDKAPGTNGEKEFSDIFRYQPLKELQVTIASGETVKRTFIVSTDKITTGSALKLTAFLQNSTTLEVYQSGQIAY